MTNYNHKIMQHQEHIYKEIFKIYQKKSFVKVNINIYHISIAKSFMSNITICMPCKTQKYINACIECGMNIGDSNPRQYCGKYRCIY
jgi:hypothetical protein